MLDVLEKDSEIEKEEDSNIKQYDKNTKLSGDGPKLRKAIASAINEIIEKDIDAGVIKKEDLFNNAKIYYGNGRNGTYFDWVMNDHSSEFSVCYNGKEQLGYISVYLYKTGELIGFKWLDNGRGKAENISMGTFSNEDTNYLINLLLQNEEDNNMFDKPIDELDWNIEVYQHDLDKEIEND